jgi:N-acetylglucosaminyldiphosphoundecaprenol N-acetyl-beta-D-mannosaminyltransferase
MSRVLPSGDPSGKAPESSAPTLRAPRKPQRDATSDRTATFASRRILGMRVDGTSYAETADAVLEMGANCAGGMICVATTHMVMKAFDDPEFRRLVNSAERVTPDGMPLVWALRRFGVRGATRVYGPSLTLEICARAEARGVPVGFYGGGPEVSDALRARMHERFPRLELPFVYSPPYRSLSAQEDRDLSEAIEGSGARVLFVGLGCPKQERWMAAHRGSLSCAMVGVGAAFDFLAGAKAQAPRWLQDAGLEWLFRLAHEPRRLWRRYLVGNSRFLFHFLLRGDSG